MTTRILHSTLRCPSKPGQSDGWHWDEEVSRDGRLFIVHQESKRGAFDGGTAERLVDAYLAGTLQTPRVKEVSR